MLQTAAHWADLHSELARATSPLLPGSEQLVRFGGAGTPGVAEFAPAELGVVLATSTTAAERLVADALDLRHRLPRCGHGSVRVRSSRGSAARPPTPPATCSEAPWRWWTGGSPDMRTRCRGAGSRRSSPRAGSSATRTPPPKPTHRRRGRWGCGSRTTSPASTAPERSSSGPRHPTRYGSTPPSAASPPASAILGDTRPVDVRRAAAVGILANPQHALDLYTDLHTATRQTDQPDDPDRRAALDEPAEASAPRRTTGSTPDPTSRCTSTSPTRRWLPVAGWRGSNRSDPSPWTASRRGSAMRTSW